MFLDSLYTWVVASCNWFFKHKLKCWFVWEKKMEIRDVVQTASVAYQSLCWDCVQSLELEKKYSFVMARLLLCSFVCEYVFVVLFLVCYGDKINKYCLLDDLKLLLVWGVCWSVIFEESIAAILLVVECFEGLKS